MKIKLIKTVPTIPADLPLSEQILKQNTTQNKDEILIQCHLCQEQKPLKQFYTNINNTNRFNKDYYCIKCRKEFTYTLRKKGRFEAIKSYWEFHENCEEYRRISEIAMVNGFGSLKNPKTYSHPSVVWAFFIPINRNCLEQYLEYFSKFYYPIHGFSLKENLKEFHYHYDRILPSLFIYLRCSKCNQFKQTYEPAFERLFSPQGKFLSRAIQPLNFKRIPISRSKTGWSTRCIQCEKSSNIITPSSADSPASLEERFPGIILPGKEKETEKEKDIDIDDCSLPVSETLPPLLENFNFEV